MKIVLKNAARTVRLNLDEVYQGPAMLCEEIYAETIEGVGFVIDEHKLVVEGDVWGISEPLPGKSLARRLFETDHRIRTLVDRIADTTTAKRGFILDRAWAREVSIRTECESRAREIIECGG